MAASLQRDGYWTNNVNDDVSFSDATSTGASADKNDTEILPMECIRAIRQQSLALRREGRFEQSWSEKVLQNGETIRFDKEGVFACEPDGGDYETAPDMLLYMSTLLNTLPVVLNQCYNDESIQESHESTERRIPLNLSNQAFNAKLAVTCAGGSSYPLHIDNTLGVSAANPQQQSDTRKLTAILYLNPEYNARQDGGELRLYLLNQQCVSLSPMGGRLLLFWSDCMPHEVLPYKPQSSQNNDDRYALTVWIPDSDGRNIQDENSKFRVLRSDEFDGETWC